MNITPDNIENPARKSGYDHVTDATSHGSRRRGVEGARWRAQLNGATAKGSSVMRFRGPIRQTAEEAAQDYCDYINTGGVASPATLKSAGHSGRRTGKPIDEEEAAALGVLRDKRAQRRAQSKGFVYCITDGTAVKIGYSLKPEARVAELQTGNPRRLRLLATKPGGLSVEKALHVAHLRHNILQEWFRPAPALLSEFGLTKEDIA